MNFQIRPFVCNPFQTSCYVVWCETGKDCFLVDPGMDSPARWEEIHRFLMSEELTPRFILLTHGHSDHVMGTGYVKHDYPEVDICGSRDDETRLPDIATQNAFFGLQLPVCHSPITRPLQASDTLIFSPAPDTKLSIEVLDCPGHSFHGLCYYLPECDVLFSGDVLFAFSVGRSDFGVEKGCNGALLVESIQRYLLPLPARTCVYPGHGPATTIAREAAYNPYLATP